MIVERFHFYKHSQLLGETITIFVVELRRLAINGNVGNFLHDKLQD